jgi:hypothetical protein
MRQPFVVVKECTIEQARQQGFTGTPERWEEIKRGYAQDMVRHHGLGTSVDFTNILFDGIGMQDSDGNWHHFPKQ